MHNKEFKLYPDKNSTHNSFRHFAFFEAYFSNYIEGTVFEVSEAKNIIDTGIALPNRGGDSHDILGTYRLVSNKNEIGIVPDNENKFLELLQSRHAILMSARTDKNPGLFKEINNKAGSTHFVDAKLVRGTLMRGFEYYKALVHPFARAAYIMFLVSEVHPFDDGNGRIARVMMNAELVQAQQSKIIIPTVYRDDYILTLKKLTNRREPNSFVEMLIKAHTFSNNLFSEDYDALYNYILSHNAFYEPDEGRRLVID